MGIMQKRMVDQTVSRFIVKNFELSNPECFVDNLDILEMWNEYHEENAMGYVINSKLILDKLSEIFKDAKLTEYKVFGIKRRQPRHPAIKKTLSAAEIEQLGKDSEMSARFNKFIYDRGPDNRTAPFELHQFANFKQTELAGGSYRMICGECSLEDCKTWLSKQDYLYFDNSINMWCFHSRSLK